MADIERLSAPRGHLCAVEASVLCGDDMYRPLTWTVVSYDRPKHPDEGTVVTQVIPVAGKIPYGEEGASTKLAVSAQLVPDKSNEKHGG